MNSWHQLWLQSIVELPVAFLCFFVVGAILWKLRFLGYWTCAVGFVLYVVALYTQMALSHQSGVSNIGKGLALGCMMPTLYMFLYQLAEKKKAK